MSWKPLAIPEPSNQRERREMETVSQYLRSGPRHRFIADHNVPIAAVHMMRQWGFDVDTGKDLGIEGRSDEYYVRLAGKNGRILLTCDKGFLDYGRYPLHTTPVIVVADFGEGSAAHVEGGLLFLTVLGAYPRLYDHHVRVHSHCDGEWIEVHRYPDGDVRRFQHRCDGSGWHVKEWFEE